jgi:SagB-type dehydrogenase family enzyme
MDEIAKQREWIKASGWQQLRDIISDQQQNLPAPPLQQPYPEDATLIDLAPPESTGLGRLSVFEAIKRRQSRRKFSEQPLTLNQLSFLCWATQGVKMVAPSGKAMLRTVPSGGARHPFETYLAVAAVEGLSPGFYRYLSIEHKLCLLREVPDIRERICAACNNQRSAKLAAATFIWTAIPYRAEWRYSIVSGKLIAQDSGHVCQNLYLACEAEGLGTCAIGAYNQHAMDVLLGVDGNDEFSIYVAPVGHPLEQE